MTKINVEGYPFEKVEVGDFLYESFSSSSPEYKIVKVYRKERFEVDVLETRRGRTHHGIGFNYFTCIKKARITNWKEKLENGR